MILKDRIAIATAAGSGIGRAGAEIMAREGATVVVADLRDDAGQETANAIIANGGQAMSVPTDVTDQAQLDALVAKTMQEYGRIDILHSHAGIQVNGPLLDADPSGMDASWTLNVKAHFDLARLVVPHMIEQGGGSVIITASNSGCFLDHEMIAYTTSKHAAVTLTQSMAIDYAKQNIRFNALCPGFIDTPFNDPYMQQMGGREALEAYVQEQIPLGRFGTAEEIAEAILFLASDRSSFMTGHALVVDGGEAIF